MSESKRLREEHLIQFRETVKDQYANVTENSK